jgi:hypothetical protein
MIVTQKIHLSLIVIPGVILGITVILLKKDIGLWLMRYGLIIAIPGVLLSVLTDKKLLDVLLLIDTGGFGRAYISGCMLLLAGMIVQSWRTIIDLKNQNTLNK